MVDVMAKWSHFYDLPAAFSDINPKPGMLKTIFFAQTFQPLFLRKRVNSTSTFYESLKVIIL